MIVPRYEVSVALEGSRAVTVTLNGEPEVADAGALTRKLIAVKVAVTDWAEPPPEPIDQLHGVVVPEHETEPVPFELALLQPVNTDPAFALAAKVPASLLPKELTHGLGVPVQV